MGEQREGSYPARAGQDARWLRAVLDNIFDALMVINHEGLIIALNPAAGNLFGYQAAELINQPVTAVMPEIDVAGLGQRALSIPIGIGQEAEGRRKDGSLFPLHVDWNEFLDSGEKCYTVVARDNTAGWEADLMTQEALAEALENEEEALEKLDQRRSQIRAILDSSVEAIALVSPEGTFLNTNDQFEKFFTLEREKIRNRNWEEFGPMIGRIFENPADVLQILGGTAPDKELEIRENVVQRWPQARELELFSRAVKNDQDDHLGRLYVFRDVTREREVDRMKTQFVSMVSHELRTPLTSIKGFTEMVLDEDAGEINEEQQEYLTIAVNNADRLIALVNDLLDVSRIESGRIQLKLEQVAVKDITTIVAATMQHLIEQKAQTFTLDVAPGVDEVEVDRDRIIQVLTNLVSNAYKYTPEGGHIRLAVERAGNFARFAVIDDGFGISEQDQAHLFERFFRVDSALTREIGGTGLGLNIVKSIVEKHGGEILVESELGVGSTFGFTVPLSSRLILSPPGAAPDALAGAGAPAHGQLILVVEDEPDIAKLVSTHLEKAGYVVDVAISGEEALAYLEGAAHLPDLITLDIRLPGISGFELATNLANDPKTADIPILVISIFSEEAPEAQLGIVNRLTKPIDRRELLHTVAEIIGAEETGKTVLIIEENPQTREELKSALIQQGYDVLLAGKGQDGLSLAAGKQPSLILLGLKLPDMDGPSVLQALKRVTETAAIPVIVASSAAGFQLSDRAKVLALGAADFVSGPFDIDLLLEEVRLFISDVDEE